MSAMIIILFSCFPFCRYGERVPLKVISRLLTIAFILVGLVLLSVFVAILTVSLTVKVAEETGMIYGAKVGFRR